MAERDKRLLEFQVIHLKGQYGDLLRFTLSELQHRGSSKSVRDIRGGNESSGIRARAGGIAFSQTELLAEVIVLPISPLATDLIDGRRI